MSAWCGSGKVKSHKKREMTFVLKEEMLLGQN